MSLLVYAGPIYFMDPRKRGSQGQLTADYIRRWGWGGGGGGGGGGGKGGGGEPQPQLAVCKHVHQHMQDD